MHDSVVPGDETIPMLLPLSFFSHSRALTPAEVPTTLCPSERRVVLANDWEAALPTGKDSERVRRDIGKWTMRAGGGNN